MAYLKALEEFLKYKGTRLQGARYPFTGSFWFKGTRLQGVRYPFTGSKVPVYRELYIYIVNKPYLEPLFDLKVPVYREQRYPVFINEKPNKGTFIFW